MSRMLQISCAIVLALGLLIASTQPAYAEIKVVSGITLATGHNTGYFYAYTSNAYVRYFLRVHIRAWGSSPNPLKDEESKYCYNCTSTGSVDVADFYQWTSTQHRFRLTSSSTLVYIYTSGYGCYSSYCWWSGGTSCSLTC